MIRLFVNFLLLCSLLNNVAANRIKDMIYMPVDGVAACFRRHNGTHQFGCSSDFTGSVGVIHMIEDETDLKWLEHNATAGPYSAVLRFNMFTKDTLIRLRSTGIINGVLLESNVTSANAPDHYSPEDTCPNRYSGLINSCSNEKPWNPDGMSLLLEDWPFPIFSLKNNEVFEEIKSCYLKHNAHDRDTQHERSLCALEMKSFMYAMVNSDICLKRSRNLFTEQNFCDPLGDRNIHWPLAPLEDRMSSVIMVMARIDANSMYNDVVPGAQSSVTGLATLLATAFYLNSLNATVDKTNIVFSILNGESADYIGSSRLVYDLQRGNFFAIGGKNLTLDRISAVIELGQLGMQQPFYLHTNNVEKFKLATKLANALSAQILTKKIPPASIQRFLMANATLPAIVITSHGEKFENKFYESILDDAERAGFTTNSEELSASLSKVAVSLGNELYRVATGGQNPPENANVSIITEHIRGIMNCYLVSADCEYFRAAFPPDYKLPDQILPLYVSVVRVDNPSTFYTSQLLKLLTGTPVPATNATECYDQRFTWISGFNKTGLCVKSTVNFSAAMSPAFLIEDYDMKLNLYSTWTESLWTELNVRMFLVPSKATLKMSLFLGGTVAFSSFIIVWFINSRASILFDSSQTVDL